MEFEQVVVTMRLAVPKGEDVPSWVGYAVGRVAEAQYAGFEIERGPIPAPASCPDPTRHAYNYVQGAR